MAQKGVQLQRENFSCPICLELQKNPVTTPCGHNFCLDCIQSYWDKRLMIYSCPQCRKTFKPRPKLVKNTMLADLVEELKKTGLQAAPADHCYDGADNVACDVCTGRKRKALKSCLVCLASFCDEHLQPHYQSPAFKKHKLVEPSKNLQENICSNHNKVMDIFCRTDHQCICYLCSVEEHKDHDTVTAAAERTQKQRELELSLEEVQKRLQDRDDDEKVLNQEVKAVNHCADKAVEDTETIFCELIQLLKTRSSEVIQHIRWQEKTEVSRVKDLQEKLQQEITELKSREAELKQLLQTDNPNQFLLNYRSPSALSPSTHSSTINVQTLRYFEDVTAAVAKVRSQLRDTLKKVWRNANKYSLAPPEPKTRAEFLKYSKEITLDPETVNTWMFLSEGNRKVTVMEEEEPDLHTWMTNQVLSNECLTGRCYWEVKWRGEGAVRVSVLYKNISRAGSLNKYECERDYIWFVSCDREECDFVYGDTKTKVSDVNVARIGVYLDHSAGLLSFYRISDDTMTLIHRVQTTFTQPLYAGLGLCFWSTHVGDTAEICKLK